MATDAELRTVAAEYSKENTWVICRHFRPLYLEQLLRLQCQLERFANGTEQGGEGGVVLEDVLLRYAMLLHSAASIAAMTEPTKLNLASIRNYWALDPMKIDTSHFGFFMDENLETKDFVCPVVLQEQPWIERKVEMLLWKAISKKVAETGAGAKFAFSDTTIQRCAKALTLAVSALVLLVPIVILNFVKDGFWPLGIVIIWTIIFTFIAGLTPMGSSEILMASAAYAAVMVVFVSR